MAEDRPGDGDYPAEIVQNDRQNPLTRIRDAYTLASLQESNANEADTLMVKHFLDTLAEIALAAATRKITKEQGEP
jgi:hypothetical protein